MASGQTQYYELNQWEGRDQVLRTEFNADNARIDRALHELRARNCQLYMLTYTGTGSGGRSFTFPHRPAAVLIMGGIVTFCVRSRGILHLSAVRERGQQIPGCMGGQHRELGTGQ